MPGGLRLWIWIVGRVGGFAKPSILGGQPPRPPAGGECTRPRIPIARVNSTDVGVGWEQGSQFCLSVC
jgi:hypothetical protein